VDDIAKSIALDHSTPALVRRENGMDVLYARHWGELCHYIKKHFGAGPPDPEDVAQEAFVKFAAVNDREAIDNPRAYLFAQPTTSSWMSTGASPCAVRIRATPKRSPSVTIGRPNAS